MEKLLFTGGTGFLGKNIMPLLEKQYDVTTMGLFDADINCDLSLQSPDLQDVTGGGV